MVKSKKTTDRHRDHPALSLHDEEPKLIHLHERSIKPLLPRREFLIRVARSFALGAWIIAACLVIGMVGYHSLEKLSWIDAFLNASMILSGMGPAATLQTDGGKVFAGCYALFSGLALISILGIIMAPVVVRFLHKFHLDLDANNSKPRKP